MLTTWLTTRFDVSVPVVSAPMAGAAGGRLAAAVSTAGGLGMIGVGDAATAAWVRQEASIAAESGAPYGVGLLAWSRPDRTGQLAAVLDAPAPPVLVSVSYGDPPGDERRYLPALHAAGIVVATQVGSRAEADRAARDGFDVLIVRGGEGGGHGRDAVATLPLAAASTDTVYTQACKASRAPATARRLRSRCRQAPTAAAGCRSARHDRAAVPASKVRGPPGQRPGGAVRVARRRVAAVVATPSPTAFLRRGILGAGTAAAVSWSSCSSATRYPASCSRSGTSSRSATSPKHNDPRYPSTVMLSP